VSPADGAAVPAEVRAALQAALQGATRRRLLARLLRSLGLSHLALAEDALQTAALRALEAWPRQGLPQQPAAWLYTVARHEAIDALRSGARLAPLPGPVDGEEDDADAALARLAAPPAPAGRLAGELADEELALLFACCHPALPQAQQVALALRHVSGLALAPLAAVLLCSEAALAQRLARAREALAQLAAVGADGRGAALALPAGAELPARREAVLTVLVLAFHAGARACGRTGRAGDRASAADDPSWLCWESIRLVRALAAHPASAHADADAAAAMLLLHGARLTGAVDDEGQLLMLPGQARDRWDAGLIRLGLQHLRAAQRAERLSRWHLMAAVAAEHALAPDWAGTQWPAIVQAYDSLLRIDGSPAPRLAHAIALAEAGEAAAALARLQALQPELPPPLQAHGLAAQARALERLGQVAAAQALLLQAAAHAPHPADAAVLRRRAAGLAAPRP
jgi:RNA polymerase sigma-70 factor, ECF subfamily